MRSFVRFIFALSVAGAFTQQSAFSQAVRATASTQSASGDAQNSTSAPPASQTGNANLPEVPSESQKQAPDAPNQQPKRILGIMPNFRAVSAGTIPPPPTPKVAFKIATLNSFDYSSYFFVGITSVFAEGTNSHPPLGKGVAGFGRYYWRGFLDKADGNYLVIFALPTIFHQDVRYYSKGKGPILKRGIYAATRILITPNYSGHNSFNYSEILGRAAAQGISATYYPSSSATVGALAVKFGYAVGRDALTNTFREFWPDIAVHVLHRHP